MNEILNSCRTISDTIFCQPIDICLFMAYYDQYVDKENGNMESMLPNGYVTSPAKLYGNYKNIREVTVRLFRDTEIQYYLLTGSEYGGDRKKVFSILCVKSVNGIIDESEYVYDVTESRERAESIFALLFKNTVTPRCLLEVLEDLLG